MLWRLRDGARSGPDGKPPEIVAEAAVAHSDRLPTGALIVAAGAAEDPAYHPEKLWVDGIAYADHRYELRQRSEFPG